MNLFRYLHKMFVVIILLSGFSPARVGLAGGAPADQEPSLAGNLTVETSYSVFLPLVAQGSGTSGNLSNGGVYVGDGGVGLGALASSLSSPVNVSIIQTTVPTLTLPANAQLLSNFFQIGVTSVISISTDSPLILAFPVPSGANTANLALAVLQSGSDVNDSDSITPVWTLLDGEYDPGQNLFLTTLASLDQHGETIALVSHPDFASPSNEAQASPNRSLGTQVTQFVVNCVHFTNPGDCTPSTEVTVEGYLSDIYDHIQGDLSFHMPRLRYLDGTLTFNPNLWSAQGYRAYIEPYNRGFCATGSAGGYYDVTEGRLVLCLNPAVGLSPDAVYTLIHEYFHATQYGYPPVLADRLNNQDEKWIIEGMAMSAEESFFSTEMLRSLIGGWVDLHKVDIRLASSDSLYEYFAQDFWVYSGHAFALGLFYLDGVLAYGARTPDVVTVLGNGDYLDVYWEYIKNQSMEATIKESGALGSPCSLYQPVVSQTLDFDYNFYNHPFQILPTLDPLTSLVVEVHWDSNYTGADGAVMPADPNDALARAALRFKLYKEGESGCESVPDGRRTYMNVDKTARYFVVISNVDPQNAYNYLVGFETWPVPPR